MDGQNSVIKQLEEEISTTLNSMEDVPVESKEFEKMSKHLDIILNQWNAFKKTEADIQKNEQDVKLQKSAQKNEFISTNAKTAVDFLLFVGKVTLTASLITAMLMIEKEGTCRSKVWNSITKLYS